ncbi:TetR/AcrR family transcriptional regulator [Hoyosella subflava]|uniref:Transcriptional regulator, TetR family n=1 Tax=Hoyosella subflava (strain DSM 45089 / JCM 17490 / NBRC 109087 / DQS3-9A1) TaxID=443218 RepID=F6ENB8_HOYSD|nr:TetR/AcrR family transcriptional regulator [Hoyosella subflava]AEF40389.1 Transcriptional regulator, TetR family [Hoyosella subflava DQS3-9A1]
MAAAQASRVKTRDRMVFSAIELMRERGSAGVTIDAILTRSEAPRGSVYYHFPAGRNQIIAEALEGSSKAISALIESAIADGPIEGLRRIRAFWAQILQASDYQAGCPVVAVIAGGGEDEQQHAQIVADTFQVWQEALLEALVAEGVARVRAQSLATMIISSIEGAVIVCRAERGLTPLDSVIAELEQLIAPAIAQTN